MQVCACVVGWYHMCANMCMFIGQANEEVVAAK